MTAAILHHRRSRLQPICRTTLVSSPGLNAGDSVVRPPSPPLPTRLITPQPDLKSWNHAARRRVGTRPSVRHCTLRMVNQTLTLIGYYPPDTAATIALSPSDNPLRHKPSTTDPCAEQAHLRPCQTLWHSFPQSRTSHQHRTLRYCPCFPEAIVRN